VHYNLLAGSGKDRTAMSFQFDSSGEDLKPLGLMGLLSPVEIPCPGVYPASSSDPCHRDAAYEGVKKYQAEWLTNMLQSGVVATYCKQQLPRAGEVWNGKITTQCDYRVSKDVMAVSTQGHMHTRGQSVRIVVNPDSARRFVALDIPRYDFHWQSSYFFEKPFKLNKGDVVRLTCTFDNTQAGQPWVNGKQDKPKYVVWGESTQDEMCVGNLQTVPLEGN
jgi:Copper type II ascorbate-dependent monooxygenase, C-terminal domain